MLIECLLERAGHTVLHVQRCKYEFKRDKEGRQVCDVLSASHAEYLLKLPDFIKYVPKAVIIELPPVQPVTEETEGFTCICGKAFQTNKALLMHKRSCKG